jgi:hypothetical protein
MNAVTECDLWKSTAEVEVDIPSSRGLSFVKYSFHSRVRAHKPQAGRLHVHCANVGATLLAFLHGNRSRRPTHRLGGRHEEADGIDFDGREVAHWVEHHC